MFPKRALEIDKFVLREITLSSVSVGPTAMLDKAAARQLTTRPPLPFLS
jgi:hypothetical protein